MPDLIFLRDHQDVNIASGFLSGQYLSIVHLNAAYIIPANTTPSFRSHYVRVVCIDGDYCHGERHR